MSESAYRFEIRTPNGRFSGERCGVAFVRGLAGTDDPKLASACALRGYAVTNTGTGRTVKKGVSAKRETEDFALWTGRTYAAREAAAMRRAGR